MRWQYLVGLFLVFLASFVFFVLVLFHTDNVAYYPSGDFDAKPTIGYSWIWYHFEHWGICLVLTYSSLVFFLHGLILDLRESGWKLSNYIKIEIVEDEEI